MHEQLIKDIKYVLNNNLMSGFAEYSATYWVTNEDLKIKYSTLNREHKSALSVLSSGDQLLNLVYNGIDKVDTFDCNRLTEYFVFGLKIPAILSLNYHEYLNFIELLGKRSIPLNDLKAVLNNADNKYQTFWSEIINNYPYIKQRMFTLEDFILPTKDYNYYNAYLENESSFNKLKNNLLRASLSFQTLNITDAPKLFLKYDIVELSNILNYYLKIFNLERDLSINEKHKLIKLIYQNNLQVKGILFFEHINLICSTVQKAILKTRLDVFKDENCDYIKSDSGLSLILKK